MGRKALEVERSIDKLEQAILLGATYELAAMYAGVSKKTSLNLSQFVAAQNVRNR
jgi:hypothetical protein